MSDSDWRRAVEPDYVKDAEINELIGLCKGVLADGTLVQEEAEFLLAWLDGRFQASVSWEGRIIHDRLRAMLADGELDADEQRELMELLADFTRVDEAHESNLPTWLPLTRPEPELLRPGNAFCLTGTFSYGPRKRVVACIEKAGGHYKSGFSAQVDVLVIGELCTPAWVHATYGRKIEAAATARDEGHHVLIVRESHLFNSLPD